MSLIYDALQSLYDMPFGRAVVIVTLANVAMALVALAVGDVLVRWFERKRIAGAPAAMSRDEVVLAVLCVVLNALVAVAGVALWRLGVIEVREYGAYGPLTVVLDFLVLFVAMDFAMYLFHRAAHHPLVYAIAHRTHHRYEEPRPLTLFVLNPLEVLGFGGLWLVVLVAYTASVEGILAYLSANLLFGLVGHLGVEPAPAGWMRLPILRYVSTSTFHAEHHLDRHHNYGFYLVVWDRLFGTLSPDYQTDFYRANQPASPAPS